VAKFLIAQVIFSIGGKPYSVNARFVVEPGEFVVVRLEGKFTPLHRAQVVSVEFNRVECKHSIVCSAADADAYGGGAAEVENEEQLDRFLCGFLKLVKHPVTQYAHKTSNEVEPHSRWHVAYMRNYYGFGNLSDGFNRVRPIFILGKEELMFRNPDKGEHIQMKDGSIVLLSFLGVHIDSNEGNIYRRAAEFAEGTLNIDVDDADTSISEIREVIGGDGYLSDGQYI